MRSHRWRFVSCVSLASAAVVLTVTSQFFCLSAWVSYGARLDACPAGTPRAGAEIAAHALGRAQVGRIRVAAPFAYSTGPAAQVRWGYVGRFSPTLELVVNGTATALEPLDGWRRQRWAWKWGEFRLPADLPDGLHRLRLTVDSALGAATHEVTLPVFVPARIHILTDRPLYPPGQTVRYRAVVLRAWDLTPLEGRPGEVRAVAPSGETVLEESVKTGDFGVLAGDFPIDPTAENGRWRLVYRTGEETQETAFTVQTFSLPRFSVEVRPVRPFYRRGEVPVLRGRVRYASGAPVRGAALGLSWRVEGDWPPPNRWMQEATDGALPRRAVAGGRGDFELRLPRVPEDLIGQVSVHVRMTAVDDAQDRVEGAARVLLARDAILAGVESELGSGVAEGYKNRVFVRVTTADGRPLVRTPLRVRRAWDAGDAGRAVRTDEDGVAALQLDPGPPQNVIVPAAPVRLSPSPPPVARTKSRDRLRGETLALADQVALDRVQSTLASCGRFVAGASATLDLSMMVGEGGRVLQVEDDGTLLGKCAGRVLRSALFTRGKVRFVELAYRFVSNHPRLRLTPVGREMPAELQEAVHEAALDARNCLGAEASSAPLPRVFVWRVSQAGRPYVSWRADPVHRSAETLASAVVRCIERRLAAVRLERATQADLRAQEAHGFGAVRVAVAASSARVAPRTPDTVKLGYALEIVAVTDGGKEIGRTTVFVGSTRIPHVRLRAEPTVASPGQRVKVEFLRGPDFTGDVPKFLRVLDAHGQKQVPLDPETRVAEVEIGRDTRGWVAIEGGGARAMVFVPTVEGLSIDVRPERARDRPGRVARLDIRTARGGRGHPASVGLVGVDARLSERVVLPGPDAYLPLLPPVPSAGPAFGVLDAQALTAGRVRGANAARALVLRVNQRVPVPPRDRPVSAGGRSGLDAIAALTEAFYRLRGELQQGVRTWERDAPKKVRLTPRMMVRLFREARARLAKAGRPAKDAYGRALSLSSLPEDLLSLVDPRVMVMDGTRLPEDMDDWVAWVREERPE